MSNGPISHEAELQLTSELQETVSKQMTELGALRAKIVELNVRIVELEESLTLAQKDLVRSQEQTSKLQRDIREVSDSQPRIIFNSFSFVICHKDSGLLS